MKPKWDASGTYIYFESITDIAPIFKNDHSFVTMDFHLSLEVKHVHDAEDCSDNGNIVHKLMRTCTMPRVAEVTGSAKSPPGGDTAPTILTLPSRRGAPAICKYALNSGVNTAVQS